jgi:hypothetical protein
MLYFTRDGSLAKYKKEGNISDEKEQVFLLIFKYIFYEQKNYLFSMPLRYCGRASIGK